MFTLPSSMTKAAKALNDNIEVMANESVAKAAQRKKNSDLNIKVWCKQQDEKARHAAHTAMLDDTHRLSEAQNKALDAWLES